MLLTLIYSVTYGRFAPSVNSGVSSLFGYSQYINTDTKLFFTHLLEVDIMGTGNTSQTVAASFGVGDPDLRCKGEMLRCRQRSRQDQDGSFALHMPHMQLGFSVFTYIIGCLIVKHTVSGDSMGSLELSVPRSGAGMSKSMSTSTSTDIVRHGHSETQRSNGVAISRSGGASTPVSGVSACIQRRPNRCLAARPKRDSRIWNDIQGDSTTSEATRSAST